MMRQRGRSGDLFNSEYQCSGGDSIFVSGQYVAYIIRRLFFGREGVRYEHHGLRGHWDAAHADASGFDNHVFRNFRGDGVQPFSERNIVRGKGLRCFRVVRPHDEIGAIVLGYEEYEKDRGKRFEARGTDEFLEKPIYGDSSRCGKNNCWRNKEY